MAIICDPHIGYGFVILPGVDVFPIIEMEFFAGPRTRFTPFATSVKTSTVKMVVSKQMSLMFPQREIRQNLLTAAFVLVNKA